MESSVSHGVIRHVCPYVRLKLINICKMCAPEQIARRRAGREWCYARKLVVQYRSHHARNSQCKYAAVSGQYCVLVAEQAT